MSRPSSNAPEPRDVSGLGFYVRLVVLSALGSAPLLSGVLTAVFLAVLRTTKPVHLSFYQAAAEILPVVLIAILVQRNFVFQPLAARLRTPEDAAAFSPGAKVLGARSWETGKWGEVARGSYRTLRRVVTAASIGLLALVSAGEWTALHALARQRHSLFDVTVVGSSLIAGFTAVVVMALLSTMNPDEERNRS